jgi:DNA-binding MarR family transcriptional regulator
MPSARKPAKRSAAGARARGRARDDLDEDCERLLAAILEFSVSQRRQEHRRQSPSGLGLGRAMQEHGLGARHASALLTVGLYGPMTVTQLANRHDVALKTASLIAVELERAGLVERREDPADRRRTIVAIAKGKERAVQAGLSKRAAHLRSTLDRLTRSQREGLITGLEVLAEEMSRDREQNNPHADPQGGSDRTR